MKLKDVFCLHTTIRSAADLATGSVNFTDLDFINIERIRIGSTTSTRNSLGKVIEQTQAFNTNFKIRFESCTAEKEAEFRTMLVKAVRAHQLQELKKMERALELMKFYANESEFEVI